jgi:hypothetical protein
VQTAAASALSQLANDMLSNAAATSTPTVADATRASDQKSLGAPQAQAKSPAAPRSQSPQQKGSYSQGSSKGTGAAGGAAPGKGSGDEGVSTSQQARLVSQRVFLIFGVHRLSFDRSIVKSRLQSVLKG